MVLNGFVALQGWLMVYFRHSTVSVFTLTLPPVSQRMSSHGMILLGGFHSHGGTPIVGWIYKGESYEKMDDLRVPPFQETS
jgi:hypothetical protein